MFCSRSRKERLDGVTAVIALTLIVCLQSAPATCRPEHIAFDGSLLSCAAYGQAVAAEWISTHPKYRLKRYTCGTKRLTDA